MAVWHSTHMGGAAAQHTGVGTAHRKHGIVVLPWDATHVDQDADFAECVVALDAWSDPHVHGLSDWCRRLSVERSHDIVVPVGILSL